VIRLPERAALFLDLDGTLIDIAPTPDSVVVPPGLPETLLALRAKLSDALAIVTGRPVAQADALLPGVAYAVAGEHGGAIRSSPAGAVIRAEVPPLPPSWLDRAQALAALHPGSILERKADSFVLHYRLAPEAGPLFKAALDDMLAGSAHHFVGASHMAWEVKPAGIDKGRAVDALMAMAPFAGRVPVFIGDDVTDEDGMRAARSHGGLGLRVQAHFADAAGVRRWLAALLS
jgi:trehalose 6-phosphate phosphatase